MRSVGSLFSGVGGFELGFEQAGFWLTWQCEIDRDAVSVLERQWPSVPRYGDIATVDPADLAPVDVVIFGSPCQDFSVAGKRAGLDGARSGLFGEAIRIIRGLRPAPALVCWENVPGTLSSAGGRDFGAVLDALAGAGALDICWRILDARWFGVPQRRRRLFVVSDLRVERAAEVLFEPQGSGRHPAARGAARQGAARDAADGAGVTGFAFGGERQSGPLDVATACNANDRRQWESETFIVDEQNAAVVNGVGALSTGLQHHNRGFAVAFHLTQDPINGAESPALGAGTAHGCATVAVAISENQRAEVRETPYVRQITSGGGKPGQGFADGREALTARRLTPRECERLMGWPDDHTRWRADGSEIADGPRYRMIGNGVVAPVARWIAERMLGVLEGDRWSG